MKNPKPAVLAAVALLGLVGAGLAYKHFKPHHHKTAHSAATTTKAS